MVTSTRPYFIRAMAEWMEDNNFTAYLAVDVQLPGVQVPNQFTMQKEVVLNISPAAVRKLQLGSEEISFDTRFSGVTHTIVVPIQAVLSIYAKETGQGVYFDRDGDIQPPPPYSPEPSPPKPTKSHKKNNVTHVRAGKRPTLKVVK